MAESTITRRARPLQTAELPAAQRRVPRALAWLIAASLLLALAWAFVSPAFQAPDENSHFGYVQTLVENGKLPGDSARLAFSSEQQLAASASNADQAAAQRDVKMEWGRAAYARWRSDERRLPDSERANGGGPNPASSNPPLYYLYEAVPYLAAGRDIFSRLLAMRIASLLWLAVTVAAAWLLAGEVLGRDRLLQLAAAGLAGLAPMMTFVSASVTPDAMLFALWTLALWLGVRILRRGLAAGVGAALFATIGLAIVVKASSYALLPGALLVLVVGLRRRGTLAAGRRVRLAGAALAGLALTAGSWFVLARLLDRSVAAQVSSASGTAGLNLRELVSYVWQFYLPRLPFMTDFPTVAHTIPVYDIWIKGVWASFGWTEVVFRNRVYILLSATMVVVVAAAAVQLWRTRIGADKAVGAFLALVSVSLLAGLHWSEYRLVKSGAGNFNQGRYLLPLAGVAGVVVALALRRVPPARRPLAVAGMLGGLLVLQVFSFGLVLERFYA